MGLLPGARNRTYTASTPVHSTDVNDIQDCIIGSKHAEVGHPHSAAAFIAPTSGAAVYGGVVWTGATDFAILSSPSYLRIGDRITRIRYGYKRTAGSVMLQLTTVPVDGDVSSSVVVATYTDSVSAGFVIHEITGINLIVAPDTTYLISLEANTASAAAGDRLCGAVLFEDHL